MSSFGTRSRSLVTSKSMSWSARFAASRQAEVAVRRTTTDVGGAVVGWVAGERVPGALAGPSARVEPSANPATSPTSRVSAGRMSSHAGSSARRGTWTGVGSTSVPVAASAAGAGSGLSGSTPASRSGPSCFLGMPAPDLLADQVVDRGAEGSARGPAIEALSDPALGVHPHRDRLVGHCPARPRLPGPVVGERVGDIEAALIGAPGVHSVVEGDPYEADLAGVVGADLAQVGLLDLADPAPGLEEVHHDGATTEVVQGDGAAVERGHPQRRGRLAPGK